MQKSKMKIDKKANLFVIGAMKSGSTSLHYYLADHPEIFMCEPKEPWYFVKEKNWSRGEQWYNGLFAEAGESVKIIGESSADYTMMPKFQGVPERIAAYNRDARFIYVMRDPVMRSISHYWHNVRWHGEQRELLTVLQKDPDLIDFSDYHLQLTTFHQYFSEDRFYVLTFEELVARPQVMMSNIYSWLNVDEKFVSSNIGQQKNVTPQTVPMIRGLGLLHKFRHSRVWNRLHRLFPAGIKKMGNHLAAREISRKSQAIEPAIDFLRPHFQRRVALLQDLLNRPFPEWRTLYDA